MPAEFDDFKVEEIHWDPGEYSKRMLIFFLFKKNSETLATGADKLFFKVYMSVDGKFENFVSNENSSPEHLVKLKQVKCIESIQLVKTSILATKLPTFEFRIYQSCLHQYPKYTNFRLDPNQSESSTTNLKFNTVHLLNHEMLMSKEVYNKSKIHKYCLMNNLDLMYYEEDKFQLYGIIYNEDYQYFDFDSKHFKFVKILKMLCFPSIDFVTIVGELEGA